MQDNIRKLIYIVLFVSCLLFGIVGAFTDPDKLKPADPNTPVTEEYVICNVKKETFTDTTNTTLDYITSNAVTLVLRNGTITSKAVNVVITYENADRYTARKNKLVSAGANYDFDDTALTIKYKNSLEQSLIEGVAINKPALQAHFTSLGYSC